MDWRDPNTVIETTEREKAAIEDNYLPAVEWFLETQGLAPRGEVVDELATHLDIDRETANLVVGHLVSDEADPVQQVIQPTEGKFVGVIDHAEHEWFYAFDRYDDVDGRQRRAVCAHCVHEERAAADVTHFTRSPEEYDVERARTALALHYQVDHEGRALTDVLAADLNVDPAAFAERHGLADPGALSLRDVTRRLQADPALQAGGTGDRPDVPDVEVKPGASLVSGTKIASNKAWHAGNDGSGTGLDADTVDNVEESMIWRDVARDYSGNARLYGYTSAKYTLALSSGESTTFTLTPTSSWPAAFVYGFYSTPTMSLNKIFRNLGELTPEVGTISDAVLVTRVTTGDTFTFKFSANYATTSTRISGVIQYGGTVNPTATVII